MLLLKIEEACSNGPEVLYLANSNYLLDIAREY